MLTLESMVRDRSVALVGSAQSLQQQDRAQQIDAHDVVIRMNLSIPGPQNPKLVGRKTDIWALAKAFESISTPPGVQHLLFMKLTKLGDHHWPMVQKRETPSTRWPQDYEDQVSRFVGSPPGTGIRLLYWLKRIAQPKSVSVFGMDCWDSPSCWSGAPAPAHNPEFEASAMEELLR